MRFVNDDESKRRYTDYLSAHERCNFQQSVEWARVKSNWKNEIILAEDRDGRIIGSLSVLIRSIPLFGNLMYCARGPVCDTHDISALRQITAGAAELAEKYHAMALRMEPDIPSGDAAFRSIAADLGYRIRENGGSHDVIQPRHVFRLTLTGKSEAEIMAGFHRTWRYNIRLAERRGVEVRECGRSELKEFHRLMAETGIRDRFIFRPLSYFERIFDELGPEHVALFMAYYNGKPIAGAIPIFYGNKTWYAFGASSNAHRNLKATYLLQWEMIKLAIARGDDIYDFRGVLEVTDENDPNSGLYQFKRGFGGELVEFIGETYMPYRPAAYAVYRSAEKAYMTIRSAMTCLKRAAVRARERRVREQPSRLPPVPAVLSTEDMRHLA